MSIKKFIPNAITLLNLLAGCIAIVYVINEDYITAAFLVFLGIFFDFFDGLVARLLNVQSALGVQLDSLADVVTSGVVPGLLMFQLLNMAVNQSFEVGTWNTNRDLFSVEGSLLPFLGFLIPLASAYRLARFNIDDEQQNYFKGLPVPANTLLIFSFPLILEYQNSDLMNRIIINPWFLVIVILLSCYLLNSPHKLFALKFKNWTFKSNSLRYIFLAFSLVALILLQFAAIPLIIILYVLFSVIFYKPT